jgi:GNAT superfamily N-acetyltransferase
MVTRGRVFQADRLPGFVAMRGDESVGLVTYRVEGGECEVTSLDSLVEGIGIGSALIEAVKQAAIAAGCKRLWLITTNDNVHALRFHQKRGFVLAALHRNALGQSRKLKPEIPLIGIDGIPLRDEIELEMVL